ncbi:cation-transporting P-type ATPase [Legionella pneumophila]|nr:cation-transporting P-type ATPase [Legionella pneumophila]
MKQDNRLHSWYDCTDADMCNELITSIKEGLTITESQNRLLKFGYNELPSTSPIGL